LARDQRPRETVVTLYNVGGGVLAGEVSTDAEWLEVGVAGAGTRRSEAFEGNRAAVRVVAFPARLRPGQSGEGRVIFNVPPEPLATTVRLRRPADVSRVTAQPDRVRLNIAPGEWGRAALTFRNGGDGPVTVRLAAPSTPPMAVSPEMFSLPPGGHAEVTLAVDSASLAESPVEAGIGWWVEDTERPAIPLEARLKSGRGLLGAFAGRRRG
jgi:hypothetical protein